MSKIRHRKRQPVKQIQRPPANHQITSKEVRLIDETGENKGIVKTDIALKRAIDLEMDLVVIAQKANPPVARIIDLSKYIYEQEKKERDAKKKQKDKNVTKGVRISIRMSSHDLNIQAQKLDKFLEKGNKIRLEMIMQGREKALQDIAHSKIEEFLSMIEQEYKIDQRPQRQPRGLYLLLSKV